MQTLPETMLKKILLPVLSLFFFCLPLGAQEVSEKGLLLRQSSSVIGPTTVSVSKNHAKVVEHRRGLTFLIDSQRLIVYSVLTKSFYETTIDRYAGPPLQNLMVLSGLSSKDYAFKKRAKPGSILGHPTMVFDIECSRKKMTGDMFADKFHELELFGKNDLDPKIVGCICRIYGLPPFSDLPAQLTYEQFREIVKGISTVAITEKTFKTSDFTTPQGLKKVAKEADLSSEGDDTLPLLK